MIFVKFVKQLPHIKEIFDYRISSNKRWASQFQDLISARGVLIRGNTVTTSNELKTKVSGNSVINGKQQ